MPPRFDFDLFAEGLARGGLTGLGAAADIAKGRREAEDLRLKQLREFFEFGERFPRADFGGAPSGGLGGLGSVAQAAGAVGAAGAASAAGATGATGDFPGLPGKLREAARRVDPALERSLLAGQRKTLEGELADDIAVLSNLFIQGRENSEAMMEVLDDMERRKEVLLNQAGMQEENLERLVQIDPFSEQTRRARNDLRMTRGAIAELEEQIFKVALGFKVLTRNTERYGRFLLKQGVTPEELERLQTAEGRRVVGDIISRITRGGVQGRRRR